MNTVRRTVAALITLLLSPIRGKAQPSRQTSAEAGKELRETFLRVTPSQIGLSATPEYPRIFGATVDWPIGEHIATVVSLSDGTASLYTTSTFGIIGGAGHASVRRAAQRFVSVADQYFAESQPTTSYPYPAAKKVRFYLLGYEGVRTIEADIEPIYSGASKYSTLFGAGQDVVTQLRQIVEKK
jgi:hypothetical protein